MLKYIIISDVSKDFPLLITALNQIGKLLLITQAALSLTQTVLGMERSCVGRSNKYCTESADGNKKRGRGWRGVGVGCSPSGQAAAACPLLFRRGWFM